MPIYEYECTQCGHRSEVLQKISDAPLTVCSNCQHESLQKLVSAAGFQLKGTGWYATDFRNKGKKPEANDTQKDNTTQDSSNTKESGSEQSSSTSSTDKES